MPTPVLEVAVDDTEFKAFIATFQKYQEQLKKQPEAWQGVNQGISDSKTSADEFASSMGTLVDAVNRLTAAEDAREQKRQQAEELKKRDAERRRREDQDEADRQRSVINRVRDYSRNVGEVVKKTGGGIFGSLGGAAEGAIGHIGGGAGGVFGALGGALSGIPLVGGILGGLAVAGYGVMSTLNNTQRQAHSMGVDTQTLQAWQTSRLGHQLPQGAVDSLLNTVSEAQASPGGGGLFGRFGVKNYNTKNVGDISGEMLINAQKYLKEHPGSQGLWGAKSLYGGALDTGTLRILQQMSPKDLKDSLDEMKKFAKDNSNAEDAATKATNDLTGAEQFATKVMNKFGGAMTSAIDQVTNALKDLFNSIQPFLKIQKDWKAFSDDTSFANTAALVGDFVPGPGTIKPGDNKGRGYDTTVAHIRSPVPISSMNIDQLLQYGAGTLIPTTRSMGIGRDKRGLVGSSATGLYQITGETITNHAAFLRQKFGNMWRLHKYDANFQDALAEQIFNENKKGDLASIWTSLHDHRAGAYSRFSFAQIKGMLARGESGGMPQADTGHVAKAVENAVKKGTMQAHRATGQTHQKVMVKTQSKPGSDVTVSARQLAGN